MKKYIYEKLKSQYFLRKYIFYFIAKRRLQIRIDVSMLFFFFLHRSSFGLIMCPDFHFFFQTIPGSGFHWCIFSFLQLFCIGLRFVVGRGIPNVLFLGFFILMHTQPFGSKHHFYIEMVLILVCRNGTNLVSLNCRSNMYHFQSIPLMSV